MTAKKSRRPVLVLATLALGVIALGTQPVAAFAKPAAVAHTNMAWSGAEVRRDGFSARRLGSFAAAPRDASGGVCDAGDSPFIC